MQGNFDNTGIHPSVKRLFKGINQVPTLIPGKLLISLNCPAAQRIQLPSTLLTTDILRIENLDI
jgi:hypothetical protein